MDMLEFIINGKEYTINFLSESLDEEFINLIASYLSNNVLIGASSRNALMVFLERYHMKKMIKRE